MFFILKFFILQKEFVKLVQKITVSDINKKFKTTLFSVNVCIDVLRLWSSTFYHFFCIRYKRILMYILYSHFVNISNTWVVKKLSGLTKMQGWSEIYE